MANTRPSPCSSRSPKNKTTRHQQPEADGKVAGRRRLLPRVTRRHERWSSCPPATTATRRRGVLEGRPEEPGGGRSVRGAGVLPLRGAARQRGVPRRRRPPRPPLLALHPRPTLPPPPHLVRASFPSHSPSSPFPPSIL
jgi:hypothetical protein